MNYDDTFCEKICRAIGPARRILELSRGKSPLAAKYRGMHPDAVWSEMLFDHTMREVKSAGEGFDVVVIGDALSHVSEPTKLLESIKNHNPQAKLISVLPNKSNFAVIERMLMGDLTYDNEGILNAGDTRIFSFSSFYKLLLDGGWLPGLADYHAVAPVNANFFNTLVEAAKMLGSPPDTTRRNLLVFNAIITSTAAEPLAKTNYDPGCKLSVVVPVTHPLQHYLNVSKSPGLHEIGAEVTVVTGATSASDGFARGVAKIKTPWVLYCHQDVYFPPGFGKHLLQILSAIPSEKMHSQIIGFSGMSVDDKFTVSQSGLVTDRVYKFDFPATERAISIDEFAIVLPRESPYKIDPNLGWHLWATDLCLQAAFSRPEPDYARIVRLPVFHNSLSDTNLSKSFHDSVAKMLAKYPQMSAIPTLCGTFQRPAA